MPSTEFAFFTGLPRTGSTIVKCVLNQNPDIYASKNSPVCNTMWNIPELVCGNIAYQASPNEKGLDLIMQNFLPLYYHNKVGNKKIIFDKGFSWGAPDNYNMIKKVLRCNPRFLVTTRKFEEVIDSLERLTKKYPDTNLFTNGMIPNPDLSFRDNLVKHLMQPKHVLHLALMGLDNLKNNHQKDTFFIEYDDFCNNPEKILKDFYKFFKLPYFKHNLSKIDDPDRENDDVYGIPTLHEIRPTIGKLNYEKNISNGASRSGEINTSQRASQITRSSLV